VSIQYWAQRSEKKEIEKKSGTGEGYRGEKD
jgi:hypothetical protein